MSQSSAVALAGKKLTALVYEIDQNKNGGQPYVIDRIGIMK